MAAASKDNDFSKGSMSGNIISMALPMTVAQLVQVIYNVVDRVYIGHMDGGDSLALTGLGLTFPIVTLVQAATNLFGMGGAPLCSIERGRGNVKLAEKIIGNTLTMLIISSFILMAVFYPLMKPILYLFGASDATFPFARQYLTIYLLGTPFIMIGSGMNNFINSEGFGRMGMMTVLLGAVVNIVLDPIFIFIFKMGIRGAAVATVISQFLSFLWVLLFLNGKRTLLKIRKKNLKPERALVLKIMGLGTAGFMQSATNGVVQIACNATLQGYGDLYVGIMTVLNSIRDVVMLPGMGLTNGAQPVIGFNYGAGQPDRVKQGIRFMTISTVIYMLAAWAAVVIFAGQFISLFSSNADIIAEGVPALRIYFRGFVFMALQMAGQSTFVALGYSKHAVFFSTLRKLIIVVPLTLILPHVGFGADGVFWAEPISNIVGGTACYLTMVYTLKHNKK